MPRRLLLWMLVCIPFSLPGQIPRFPLYTGFSSLSTSPRPAIFFDVNGEQAAVLGQEAGGVEIWIFPFQIVTGFQWLYRIGDMPQPEPLIPYMSRFETRPEYTTRTYSHPLFRLKEHFFVPVQLPAVVILLDIQAYQPLELYASFMASLQPMWPAGLGGQYAFWDDRLQAYILSESRRKYNAIIGASGARKRSPPLAHALPQRPNLFSLDIHPDSLRNRFLPVVFTADFRQRDQAIRLYQQLLASIPAEFQRRSHDVKSFLTGTLNLKGTEFDGALLWNKLALRRGLVCNPDLGCGLVAGYGPSGASRRPGFAWFFGGDAFINSLAMLPAGDHKTVRQAFKFLQTYQRADGKMMHELSQAAGLIDWFGEYPYGYIHGDTTPFYLTALHEYFLWTNDTAFVRESWPSVEKAYRWCRSTDSDGDGLMENTLAGLGASELGSLLEASGVDIFLAAIGVQAWKSTARLAKLVGRPDLAAEAQRWFERGKQHLESRFWNADSQWYNFSITRSGKKNPELTAWSAFPIIFDLLPAAHARQALTHIASSKIATDWGSRMLSRSSAAYDPLAYNNGAVWPFLSGYAIWALFRQHHEVAGLQALRNLARWVETDALGTMPEVVSGEFFRPLDSSVPHQLFSSFGFVAGLLRGWLGLEVHAPRRLLRLTPHFTPETAAFQLENLIIGGDTLSLELEQTSERFVCTVLRKPRRPINIELNPAFGPFAHLRRLVAPRKLPVDRRSTLSDTHFAVRFATNEVHRVELQVDDPFRIWPAGDPAEFGEPMRQLKVLNIQKVNSHALDIQVEGPAGMQKRALRFNATRPFRVNHATVDSTTGTLVVEFTPGSGYIKKTITIDLLPERR